MNYSIEVVESTARTAFVKQVQALLDQNYYVLRSGAIRVADNGTSFQILHWAHLLKQGGAE